MVLLPENSRDEVNIRAESIMPLIRERLAAGQTVRNMGFQGVSMLPMLRQGKDFVELAPLTGRLRKYDLPLYRTSAGKYVMHRVVGERDGRYICLGDNTYHYETVAPEQVVAVVCAFTRGGRRIETDNRCYRMYCRVWCAMFPVRRLLKGIERRVKGRVKRLLKR